MSKDSQPFNADFDISKEVVKVRLAIGQYTGRKKSEALSRETASKHGADDEVVDTILKLLKEDDRKPIKQAANAARTKFYELTLPFESDNWYLIPTNLYPQLQEAMAEIEAKFTDAVNHLLSRYQELVSDYERRFGSLKDYAQFPSEIELANKYYFRLDTDVVANTESVHLKHLSSGVEAKVKAGIEKRLKQQVADSQVAVAERITDLMGHIAEKLDEPAEGKRDSKIFRDSLMKNVWDALEVLPQLNLMQDSRIDNAISKIKEKIAPVAPQVLREDKEVRKKVKKAADEVLTDLKDFKPITI